MKRRELERVVVDLAEGQWGLVTSAQARLSGVSRVQLARLVDDSVLIRLAHGVYVLRAAVGTEHLELRAAWLGLDPERMAADRLRNRTDGAVVSHASAARLHQLGDLDADRHEFTLAGRKQSRRSDVRLHRGVLQAEDVAIVAGLPVTRPERVVVDLLSDRHDGEHVAGVLAGAVASRSIDLERLAPWLEPFAARFGFPARAGEQVLDHLLELGGAADHVVADDLVTVARAHNLSVQEMMREALSASSVQEMMREALSRPTPSLQEMMREALSASSMQQMMREALSISNTETRSKTRRARKGIEGTSG
jgi:predicted transcriptional regulator of viral defense system